MDSTSTGTQGPIHHGIIPCKQRGKTSEESSVSNEKLISAKNLKTCVLLRWIYNERHPLEGEGPTSNPSSLVKKKKEDFRRELDEGLDVIGEGLATLENMASDMNEELDRHVLVQASSLDG